MWELGEEYMETMEDTRGAGSHGDKVGACSEVVSLKWEQKD